MFASRGTFYRYVSGDCWSAFLGHVVISLDGSCACHGIFIQRLKGLAATAVTRGAPPTESRARFSAFASPQKCYRTDRQQGTQRIYGCIYD